MQKENCPEKVSSSNKILSHGKIYLMGNIIQRCVSFVMLPIYTRFLTPSDYGTIELLSMVLDFVGIILGLRIGQSIFRFYSYYEEKKDKDEVITTAVYLVFSLNVIGFLILFLMADNIAILIFDEVHQSNNIILFSLTLLMQAFIEIPMTYLRARQLPWVYVWFSLAKLSIQLSLNVILIVILRMKVEGMIYSAVISSAIMAIALSGYVIKNCGMKFSYPKSKQLFSFSLPLVLTGVLSFYITFGDRYFLRLHSGIDEVGVYSLAYKFGFLLMFIVVNPFMAIWDSEKFNIINRDDYRKKINEIFIYYSTIILLICIAISLFVKCLLQIMADASFWGAAEIVPVVLAAYLTNAWCEFINLGILLKNKTIEITYGTLISGLIITVGYLFLIPKYGAMGAAWATFLAFGARALWVYYRAKRLYDLGITWTSSWAMVVLWAGVYGIAQMGQRFSYLGSLLLNISLFCCVLVIIFFTPLLPVKVRFQLHHVKSWLR